MVDSRNLSEEIARLDKMIESFEVQLNEIRQQREFKAALLRQASGQASAHVVADDSVQQSSDVISE
jgi:hypothetical protein